MAFTWIPFYEELAAKLLEYETRQEELCAFRRQLDEEGLKPGLTQDRPHREGDPGPLQAIDPFSMFASFNCGADDAATLTRRLAILARVRIFFNVNAPVPTDLVGSPLVDNQNSVYFPFAYERQPDDISTLWALARQGVQGGRDGILKETFARARQVKNVGVARLTVGLFWMRPWEFLPLDSATKALLGRARLPFEAAAWDDYLAVVDACIARLGVNFPALSLAAYNGDEPRPLRRYWAGGHLWDDGSHLDEFRTGHCWKLGYGPDDVKRAGKSTEAKRALDRFAAVQTGDWLAIKGWGGRNDLVVHLVGEVIGQDLAARRLDLRMLPRPELKLKGPEKPGDGNWSDALLEIKRPEIVQQLFGVTGRASGPQTSPPASANPVPDIPLNLILYGPPGTGKTWWMVNELLPRSRLPQP